ncbi:uncharacterized protein LOC111305957 [Durio zibethinus]|uniref:Uncharacterized protein LOC111305957 n=1 Tax=Durio zibethinus TaxID=66656 RepID=A0A6P6A3K7_DURZI|nr:uncharacterized protein LOC111305957 [Durio zibethinus]
MELNKKKLQTLIERAWALRDRLNDEIENSISFCRFCSDHGRYCDIGHTPFEERERLIAIRDSLKEVENTLLHLQKLQFWQLTDRHSALTRMEQSRLFLIKQVKQYQGRPLDVVKELNSCFGNDNKTGFDRKVEEITVKKNGVESRSRRLSSFLICCTRVLFNPWMWQSGVGFAVKLILISASLSSVIQFYHAKQQSCSNSQRKIVSVTHSKEAEKLDTLLTISKMPLDVFCGRG